MDDAVESQAIDFTLLKAEDRGAWKHVLRKLVSQEAGSSLQVRKRDDWGVCLEELLGELYEDMIGRRKLWNYKGEGSLLGWMRAYMRGYLNRKNPHLIHNGEILLPVVQTPKQLISVNPAAKYLLTKKISCLAGLSEPKSAKIVPSK